MKPFLIAACLATLVVVGLAAGYLLQRQTQDARLAREQTDLDAAGADLAKAKTPTAETAVASSDEDDEDDDEAYIRDSLAKRALMDNCQTCHEQAMFQSQRLTPPQWKAEVEKMVSWGATLPEEDRESVAEYLARHYGPDTPAEPPRRIDLADAATLEIPGDPHAGTDGADPARGAQLYAATCASCHGPTALGEPAMPGVPLGPALANRAPLTHADYFYKLINEGRRNMPAMNAALDAQQQRDILAWLRSLGYDQSAAAPASKS